MSLEEVINAKIKRLSVQLINAYTEDNQRRADKLDFAIVILEEVLLEAKNV